MRISEVEIYRADIPFKDTFLSRMNVRAAKDVVVKVSSEDGLVGIGTTSPVPKYLGATQGIIIEGAKFLASTISGQNPFDIEKIHSLMNDALADNWPAKAAIDLALYDLMGKAVDKPVYQLLGGKVRDHFYTQFNFGMKQIRRPTEIAKIAKKAVKEGFRAFEVKVGIGLKADIARIKAIREAIGDEVILVADANRAWTTKEAIESIRALQGFNNIIFEEPTLGLEEMLEVREAVDAPVCADESCHTLKDAREIVKKKAADVLCIKIMKAGGILNCKKIATLCDSFNVLCRIDGVPGETLVSNTAGAHIALNAKTLIPAGSGVMQHYYTLKEDVATGGLIFNEGKVTIGEKPGLGIKLRKSMLTPA